MTNKIVNGVVIELTEEEAAAIEQGKKDLIALEESRRSYVEKRVREYPPIAEQLDMLYKDMANGTSTWVNAIATVKAKHPKPE